MPAAQTVRATTSFAGSVNGADVLVQQGDRYAHDHPVVKAHATFFEPEDADVHKAPKRRSRKT